MTTIKIIICALFALIFHVSKSENVLFDHDLHVEHDTPFDEINNLRAGGVRNVRVERELHRREYDRDRRHYKRGDKGGSKGGMKKHKTNDVERYRYDKKSKTRDNWKGGYRKGDGGKKGMKDKNHRGGKKGMKDKNHRKKHKDKNMNMHRHSNMNAAFDGHRHSDHSHTRGGHRHTDHSHPRTNFWYNDNSNDDHEDLGHGHSHTHAHSDGTIHRHRHNHDDDESHHMNDHRNGGFNYNEEHQHPDGNVHTHGHGHGDSDPGNHGRGHDHGHNHRHTHGDGTTHTHGHNHDDDETHHMNVHDDNGVKHEHKHAHPDGTIHTEEHFHDDSGPSNHDHKDIASVPEFEEEEEVPEIEEEEVPEKVEENGDVLPANEKRVKVESKMVLEYAGIDPATGEFVSNAINYQGSPPTEENLDYLETQVNAFLAAELNIEFPGFIKNYNSIIRSSVDYNPAEGKLRFEMNNFEDFNENDGEVPDAEEILTYLQNKEEVQFELLLTDYVWKTSGPPPNPNSWFYDIYTVTFNGRILEVPQQ